MFAISQHCCTPTGMLLFSPNCMSMDVVYCTWLRNIEGVVLMHFTMMTTASYGAAVSPVLPGSHQCSCFQNQPLHHLTPLSHLPHPLSHSYSCSQQACCMFTMPAVTAALSSCTVPPTAHTGVVQCSRSSDARRGRRTCPCQERVVSSITKMLARVELACIIYEAYVSAEGMHM